MNQMNISGEHVIVVIGNNCNINATYTLREDSARIYNLTLPSRSRDEKITGPDQLLSKIAYSVYCQLTALLTRDKIKVAARVLYLTLEETNALSTAYEHPGVPVDAVFQLMMERKVNLGELVKVLKDMQRFDAIGMLTDAGYPDHVSGEAAAARLEDDDKLL